MTEQSRHRPLWLDHVTLSVPDLTEATAILRERFGLRVTPTPADPSRHGRIYLHYGYVEVAATPDDHGAGLLALTGFYLGHADVAAAMELLRGEELATEPPAVYHGADGAWWDGTLLPPEGVPAPILVQRFEPPDLAPGWPPPLAEPHPSGIVALSAVLLVTARVPQAVEFYDRLIAALAQEDAAPDSATRSTNPGGGRAPADQQWDLTLPGGGRIVIYDPMRAGPARDHLMGAGSGLLGIELGSVDLDSTRAFLDCTGVTYHPATDQYGPFIWIDAAATPGILLAVR